MNTTRFSSYTSEEPIITSLLDIDFYKFPMRQFVATYFPEVETTFALTNRSTLSLAILVPEEALRRELDHARTLTFTRTELAYLRGMDVYGANMFSERFLGELKSFRLPPYSLTRVGDQYDLEFQGRWADVSLWETIAMSILTELRTREGLRRLSAIDRQTLYARAWLKLVGKLMVVASQPDIRVADFATRRRHSRAWHEHAVLTAVELLGPQFTGTSDTQFALAHSLIPIGTNAHELPMVLAALAKSDEERRASQYRVPELWQTLYGKGLRIFLPDTFGTAQFLEHAPAWLAHDWRGARQDSADPLQFGERLISWYKQHEVDPRERVMIASDGLDVDRIVSIASHFRGRLQTAFGWGTLFANDFRNCSPDVAMEPFFAPMSIVVKPSAANGEPTVKLSDNTLKAVGPKAVVTDYLRLFGDAGRVRAQVIV